MGFDIFAFLYTTNLISIRLRDPKSSFHVLEAMQQRDRIGPSFLQVLRAKRDLVCKLRLAEQNVPIRRRDIARLGRCQPGAHVRSPSVLTIDSSTARRRRMGMLSLPYPVSTTIA